MLYDFLRFYIKLKEIIAETVDYFYVLVSRDTACIFIGCAMTQDEKWLKNYHARHVNQYPGTTRNDNFSLPKFGDFAQNAYLCPRKENN